MSLVTTVRLVSDTRRWYVSDLAAIAANGGESFEAVLPVGDINDPVILQQIGEAYLAQFSAPVLSVTAEAINIDDARAGTTVVLDVDDVVDALPLGLEFPETAFTQGVRRTADPSRGDGGWTTTAAFNSLPQETQIRNERVMERLIAANGGGSAQASTVKNSRTKVPKGKLQEIGRQSWTWNELWDIDEEPWQTWKVEDPCRLYAFRVIADWFTLLDGEIDEKVTDGPSSFTFSVNGDQYDPAPFLQIGDEEYLGILPLWGSAVLNPGDEVRVWALQNGGHINGALELLFSEPI